MKEEARVREEAASKQKADLLKAQAGRLYFTVLYYAVLLCVVCCTLLL